MNNTWNLLNSNFTFSLKKNIIVLKDHEIALEKTLKNLIENGHSTR